VLSILNKAQSFSIDLVIALLLFGFTLLFYYETTTNLSANEIASFKDVLYNAKVISSYLISEGYPTNWTKDNVSLIGIMTNNRVNETKLEMFASMDYSLTKQIFNTPYDYYLFFQARNGSIVPINDSVEGIGKPGVSYSNLKEVENPRHLVTIHRIVIRSNDIMKMVIYQWH